MAATLALDLSAPDVAQEGVGSLAFHLVGSEILRIAGEVRTLRESGAPICDLTVGDFSPQQFRIPQALEDAVYRALAAGETNYPPSDGIPALRRAVAALYEQRLGLSYPIDGIGIASGARPVLWASYQAVVEPGDKVVYPIPSWNNNHYCHLTGGLGVAVPTTPEAGFLPTAADLEPHLRGARLLVLNSPLNPAGTGFHRDELGEIAERVVAENRRRGASERPLFLLFDQIYWLLAAASAPHFTPVDLVPEVGRYTIFVDGISKALAATGLRVGWAVGPPYLMSRMRDLIGHLGAWAPRPEQVATAEVFADPGQVEALVEPIRSGALARLEALYAGLSALGREGYPVSALPPAGAIYLSAKFDLLDRFGSDSGIRRFLLEKAGLAAVPFRAFGYPHDSGWFRLSIGAVSIAAIEAALPRLQAAFAELG
ncbi:MAG TPA: aminotransferase class I/II-fold pyridoxal phosphate-dependent enzyme [Thermoanaerobaculia bacterium]|jgi:aspartate aminotransferase|nr:aminotransferase class I/II-fold pyridoxal phosphate-dependent enzyme [Thermoanaerobaculia bacterium]